MIWNHPNRSLLHLGADARRLRKLRVHHAAADSLDNKYLVPLTVGRLAPTDFYLLLDDDTLLKESQLHCMRASLERQAQAVAAAPRVSMRAVRSGQVVRALESDAWQAAVPACMLVRRVALEIFRGCAARAHETNFLCDDFRFSGCLHASRRSPLIAVNFLPLTFMRGPDRLSRTMMDTGLSVKRGHARQRNRCRPLAAPGATGAASNHANGSRARNWIWDCSKGCFATMAAFKEGVSGCPDLADV